MANANLKIERREFLRHRTSFPVKFKSLDTKKPFVFEATTHDISLGGIFVNRFKDEPKRAIFDKHTDFEVDLNFDSVPLKSRAEVVRIIRGHDQKEIEGLGIRFSSLVPEDKTRLSKYISKITSPHIPAKIKSIRGPDYKLSDRGKRNLDILDVLRRGDPVSKTLIAQEADFNIVTVSNYVDEFKKKGIIFEKGFDESSGGRRPSLLEINANYGFTVGVELNLLTKYANVVLVDFAFKTVAKKSLEITIGEDGFNDRLIEQIIELIYEVIAESKVERNRILGTGVGLTTLIDNYANYRELLENKIAKTDLSILIERNSIANIFAEKWTNKDLSKVRDVLYLGLDGSFSAIIRGGVYLGSNHGGLRMGLDLTKPSDSKRKDCWANEACALRHETLEVNSDNVREIGERLGVKIAYLINLFAPQVIIVGGVAEQDQTPFFEAVRNSVKRWTFSDSAKTVRIIPSQLKDDSVALGMAALVCREIYTQI